MESPPVKPPRREKYSKETTGCGLLVSVIKTLDASENNEQRQKEKQKIEKEFKKSDQVLKELISKHDGDLTKIMQLFGTVSTHVTISRERIHAVKENLHACKQLLCCRREELKKLWVDAVQQKYVLEMLDQISELRKVPSVVAAFIAKRQYLHATKSLTSAIALGDGPLRQVEGLKDLRKDLASKKNLLYNRLHEELNRYLYHMPMHEFLSQFERHGSTRTSNGLAAVSASPFQRNVLRKSAERAEANSKVRKALFEMTHGFDMDKSEVLDENEIVDTELNQTYFFGIIVECFALLDKVPESLESIQVQVQSELTSIVTKTSQHLNGMRKGEEEQGRVHPLLELIETLFKQLHLVADAHRLLLKSYDNVLARYTLSAKTSYDVTDYWTHAQTVVEHLLTDYFDIQNGGVGAADEDAQARSNAFAQEEMLIANLSGFFSKRKVPGKRTLFRFDKTSSIVAPPPDAAATKEHRRTASDISTDESTLFRSPLIAGGSASKRERVLVCEPDMAIIRVVYLPLLTHVAEIENITKTKSDQPCSLHQFLGAHIKDTFLARGHNRNLQMTIDTLAKSQDAWKAIVSPEEIKRLGLTKPLLQSTVLVETKIRETKNLIRDLPNYSDELLKTVCCLLKSYRETCQMAYRGIVESEDKRVYSVNWLKDEDISRFLKSLPNWTDLKASHHKLTKDMYQISEDDTMAQIQERNRREAEMLTSNLGEGGISHKDLLSDVGVLKELAIMQQSMEWFSIRISEFARDLKKPIASGLTSDQCGPVVINEGTIKVLTNLSREFEELANTCLLVLHLEVRVQCFHYLQSFSKEMKARDPIAVARRDKTAESLEPDLKVLKLTKVLSDMDEAFTATLHPRKVKYIFEGLAHLIARILMMASEYMEHIDQASVQKMCRNAMALQQTLSSITASRETALDNTRMYYELFYMNPEEIINQIVEKGPQFSEFQYLKALEMICKSRGTTDQNMLNTYQQKLSDLLGSKPPIGITV